jgi:hypothetical protein
MAQADGPQGQPLMHLQPAELRRLVMANPLLSFPALARCLLRVYNVPPLDTFFSIAERNFACMGRNVAASAFKQHREFCYEIAIARL